MTTIMLPARRTKNKTTTELCIGQHSPVQMKVRAPRTTIHFCVTQARNTECLAFVG